MIRRFADTGGRIRAALSVVYLAVLVTAPVVDAAIEAIIFEQTTHVESQTDGSCYAGHDEVMCQLCRLIEVPGLAMARVRLDVAAKSQPRSAQPLIALRHTTPYLDASPSRAPPAA